MELVSNFIGYRLAMTPEFQQAESLQVYKGIIAKIMVLLNQAFTQQILDETGRTITLAVDKKSLGHYVWRHNRCRYDAPDVQAANMQKLYQMSHKKHQAHKYYTDETAYLLAQRGLFNAKPLKIDDFIKIVKEQAPLKGCFYKIKKDSKTVGYLLGTIHLGNELLLNLNPKVNRAIDKSQVIAGELPIDRLFNGTIMISIKNHLQKKHKEQSEIQNYIFKKARINRAMGIEKNLLNRATSGPGESKKFIGLETVEEQQRCLNQEIEKRKTVKFNSIILYFVGQIAARVVKNLYRNVLSGSEKSSKKDTILLNRNHIMAERAVPFLQGDKRTFIAVGNAHLHGEEGVCNLLKAKGYTLKQI